MINSDAANKCHDAFCRAFAHRPAYRHGLYHARALLQHPLDFAKLHAKTKNFDLMIGPPQADILAVGKLPGLVAGSVEDFIRQSRLQGSSQNAPRS